VNRAAYDGAMRHYLDHAARSALRPRAREAWHEASDLVGNPSSLHQSGRAARSRLEDARELVASLLGAHPTEVIFTSGGTEADNIGIVGAWWAHTAADPECRGIVTTAVEHHAALDPVRWLASRHGAHLSVVGVDAHARIEADAVAEAVDASPLPTAVVSVQWVNNEVGTVQPLAQVVEVARRRGVPVHADAVQGVGHMPFDFAASGLASAAMSGHKVGAPVGVGVLLAKRDAALAPVMWGGGQERRLRSGTVDAASAWACAVALEEAVAEARAGVSERLIGWGTRIEQAIHAAAGDAIIHGPSRDHAAPHIVHAIIPGAPAEALLTALDLAHIDASPGAACTAGVIEPSHVVEAMGYGATAAAQTLRLSCGWSTTDADVEALAAALPGAVASARATRGGGTSSDPRTLVG